MGPLCEAVTLNIPDSNKLYWLKFLYTGTYRGTLVLAVHRRPLYYSRSMLIAAHRKQDPKAESIRWPSPHAHTDAVRVFNVESV